MVHVLDPHAEITWLEKYKAIHIKWKHLQMPTARFYEICAKAASMVVEHKATIWLADQYNSTGAFSDDVQKVIADNLYAMAPQLGLKSVLTILPKEKGTSYSSTEEWTQKAYNCHGISAKNFATLEHCLAWIKEQE